jgi:hypothetical protein
MISIVIWCVSPSAGFFPDFQSRAAVVIEPVSADRLRKAGIQRPKRMREKPGFPTHSRVS